MYPMLIIGKEMNREKALELANLVQLGINGKLKPIPLPEISDKDILKHLTPKDILAEPS